MTHPMDEFADATARFRDGLVQAVTARCTAVNTTARTCEIDNYLMGSPPGPGVIAGTLLRSVPYIGLAPLVGATVIYLVFGQRGYVIGGTGAP